MIDSFHQFQGRVGQLISFFDDAETISALADIKMVNKDKAPGITDIDSHLTKLRSNKIDRRIQTYASGIVLLYGLFEQYVEEIMVAYLEEMNATINNFDDMPRKIKENHTTLSAQLLINRDLDKYRDRCSEADIIQRMHSCMRNKPYRLNTLAFIDHKSNFRIEPLNRFFELAGISGMSTLLKKTIAFREYSASRFPGQKIDNLPDTIVFEDLDDLAWRRNVVAHGWPDDTLSLEMMKERAEFIRVLGECIYEALRQSVIPHIIKHQCYPLPKPLFVINNSIVCIHLEHGSLMKGSQLMVSRSAGYLEGKILSIEIDHVQQMEVVAPPSVDVAFSVDFKAKDNYQYFVRKAVM
ncbi:MAG: MAE_28990/MAE_18760 family HEPN-like nuclease [Salinivirgaceae bacterium]|nr:MAE_28990/MAE_18760 family HEPN-like nuclease [Salinivirgaceae bacterium]